MIYLNFISKRRNRGYCVSDEPTLVLTYFYYGASIVVKLWVLFVSGGHISCTRVDFESETAEDVILNMGDLLQALLGCPALPKGINEGLLKFDHKSDQLTTVNTCAPSINFSKL